MKKLLFTLICSLSLFSFSSFSMSIQEFGRAMAQQDPEVSQEVKDSINKSWENVNQEQKKNTNNPKNK